MFTIVLLKVDLICTTPLVTVFLDFFPENRFLRPQHQSLGRARLRRLAAGEETRVAEDRRCQTRRMGRRHDRGVTTSITRQVRVVGETSRQPVLRHIAALL